MSPRRLAPGSTFAGEYTITRLLAEGGMGEVYVARQASTGRERALKVMHPWLADDPTSRERFEREARVGARIASDHVVDVIAAGVEAQSGRPWLAMELVRGETLQAYVAARGALPPAEAREILAQIAHALGAAHRERLVHRDLKPDNVMVSDARAEGGRLTVKLLDFGIAKLVQERRAGAAVTGAIGSPQWMAPEQTEASDAIGPRTDVWAFGLLAFWLLTGELYWLGANAGVHAILRELHVDPLEPASARAARRGARAALPAGFDEWFARAVARPLEHRYADASEAMAALDPILARAALGVAGTLAVPIGALAPATPITLPPAPQAWPGGAPATAPGWPTPAGHPAWRERPHAPSASPWAPASPVGWTAPAPRASPSPWLLGLLALGLGAAAVGVGFLAWALATRDDAPAHHDVAAAGPAPAPAAPIDDAGAPLVPLAAVPIGVPVDVPVTPVPARAPAPAVASTPRPVATPAARPPAAPMEPAPPPIPFRAGQRWRGTYQCAQGHTQLTLSIRAVTGRRVAAIFRFQHATARGAYHLAGDYQPATRRLALSPGAWIERPPNYETVGMDGAVDPSGRLYAGRITNPACGAFRVTND
ncbi:MAG: protein kinase [Sandaracinaceae bacterium]|nr:protein kinase [Sandaracinaceae bacterium]